MIHLIFDHYRTTRSGSEMPFPFTRFNLSQLFVACLAGICIALLLLVSPWLALAITAGIIVCIAAFVKPIILCYVMIAAISLTSGMERGKLIPFLRPNELVILFAAGIGLIVILTRKTYQRLNLHPISFSIMVLVGGTTLIPGISYLLRGRPLSIQDILILLAPLQYILLFWLFANLPSNNVDRRKIIQLMLLCGAIVATVGILQAARFGFVTNFLHQWYSSAQETRAINYGRVTSLMSAWNVLGIFLMVNLFITWAFGIYRGTELGKAIIIVSMCLCMACLIISGSYAGIIGSVLGILIITFLLKGINRKTIILLLGISVFILLVIILFKPFIQERFNAQFRYGNLVPETLSFRFKVWREIFLPAMDLSLWGSNLTIPATFSFQYTESQYLTLLFSFGLVGLIAFLTWIGITLTWLIRRFRQHYGLLKVITAVSIAIILVLCVTGFTNAVFTYSGTADYLWIILALLTAEEAVRAPTPGD